MKSLEKNSLLAIVILTLLTLLASCASEATKLNVEPQEIELQADGSKSHSKDHDGKQYHKRANSFELVASTIGIDLATLKAELGADKSIATIAQANGVAAQTVINVLAAKSQSQIDAAIAAGKISAEDASAWQTKMSERAAYFVNNTSEFMAKAKDGRKGKGHKGKGGKAKYSEIAQLIGIDVEMLYMKLKAGKSIADVATANGLAPQKIIDALMVDMQAKLDAMVAAGKLNSDEAAEKASAMKEQITAWVNGTARAKGGK